jgi:hypothetical protein
MIASWTVDPVRRIEAGRVRIENLYVFIGVSALLVSYILYTMIRKRKGERPGFEDRETEL